MPFAPSCGWLNMPYLFGSLEEFRKLVDLMWDQHNAWAVKESGARVLAIVNIGYRQLTTDAAHPVRNLADARGLAVRTAERAGGLRLQRPWLQPHPASFADTYGMPIKGKPSTGRRVFQQRGDHEVRGSPEVRHLHQLCGPQRQHHRQ